MKPDFSHRNPDKPPIVKAQFESECDGCGGLIEPGDDIRADGAGGWECGDCIAADD